MTGSGETKGRSATVESLWTLAVALLVTVLAYVGFSWLPPLFGVASNESGRVALPTPYEVAVVPAFAAFATCALLDLQARALRACIRRLLLV
jgi:hypothetical protein